MATALVTIHRSRPLVSSIDWSRPATGMASRFMTLPSLWTGRDIGRSALLSCFGWEVGSGSDQEDGAASAELEHALDGLTCVVGQLVQ